MRHRLCWALSILLHVIPLAFLPISKNRIVPVQRITLSSIQTRIVDPPKKTQYRAKKALKTRSPKLKSQKKKNGSQDQYLYTVLAYLQEELLLPESGLVKITISIAPNGNILCLNVTESKNKANCHYLQETLPSLNLPATPDKKGRSYALCFCDSM